MGMSGCALVYVGFALFISALMLPDQLDAKQAAPMNIFLGGLISAHAMSTVFLQGREIGAHLGSMQLLLFAFTLLWLSVNQIWELEGKGSGLVLSARCNRGRACLFDRVAGHRAVHPAADPGRQLVRVFPSAGTGKADRRGCGLFSNRECSGHGRRWILDPYSSAALACKVVNVTAGRR